MLRTCIDSRAYRLPVRGGEGMHLTVYIRNVYGDILVIKAAISYMVFRYNHIRYSYIVLCTRTPHTDYSITFIHVLSSGESISP